MRDPARYFAKRGFGLSFSRPDEDQLESIYLSDGHISRSEYERLRRSGAIGPVAADLYSLKNPKFVQRLYGTGASEAEAALRAVERWRTEQGD